MAGAGGFALSRSHSGDRFYNPPAMRRHQQMLLQQQQMFQRQQQQHLLQLQRATKLAEVGNRDESDDSLTTLSQPHTIDSSSPPWLPPTNLDRLLESVTPFITARCFPEVKVRDCSTWEAELLHFYCLEDLWESFSEWSVYGVGVPLVLNGKDQVKQYFVPFLSGIQLYVDPSKPHSRLSICKACHTCRKAWTFESCDCRNCFYANIFQRDIRRCNKNLTYCVDRWRPGEESDAESLRETSTGGCSDCEVDRQSKSSIDGLRNQRNLMNLNTQLLNRLSLRETSVTSASSAEVGSCNSPGQLLFEYLEQEQPRNRKPLTDKISALAFQFPELRKLRSCDLLPASWISVAWYPIYRIPVGTNLRDLDASFLTFHCLSTHSKCNAQQPFHGAAGQKVHGFVDVSLRMSLPVFGLASYKLKGSILTPCGPHECDQESSLLQAADNWLRHLHVGLPDYQFFRAHYAQWR